MEAIAKKTQTQGSAALRHSSPGRRPCQFTDTSRDGKKQMTRIPIEDGWEFIDEAQSFLEDYSHEDPSLIIRLRSILSKLVPVLRPQEGAGEIKSGQQSYEKLGSRAQRLCTQQVRCSLLRAQAQPMRSQLAYERQELRKCLDFVLESVKQALSAIPNSTNYPAPTHSPQSSHRNLIEEDRKRFSSQTGKLEKVENALSNIDFQLQQEEQALEKQIREFVKELQIIGVRMSEQAIHASEPGLDTTQSSNEVEPCLQNFYDKLGEAKVLHERLVEFEDEYDEARARIIFEEEQERVPERSLDELESNSSKKRDELRNVLNRACESAEAARLACLEAGLDPEAYKMDIPNHDNITRPQSPEQDGSTGNGSDRATERPEEALWNTMGKSQETVGAWKKDVWMTIRRRHSEPQLHRSSRVGLEDC